MTEREPQGHGEWMRHSFTFFGNGRGAAAAAAALRQLGFDPVDVDEEVSGDGYWHIAAFKVGDAASEGLRELAARFGGDYVGCEIAALGDGSGPDPARPLA